MSLIRGGQLCLHYLRMIQQVLWVLVRVEIVAFTFVMCGVCFAQISIQDWKIFYYYMVARLLIMLQHPEFSIVIKFDDEVLRELPAWYIVHSEFINAHVGQIVQKLMDGLYKSLWYGISLAVVALIIFAIKGHRTTNHIVMRGGTLISAKKLRKMIKQRNKEVYYSYSIGDIPYPSHAEYSHTLIAGSTGSGKTVLIADLLSQIKERGDKAIIFDKMGVYTERFYDSKQDKILNPFDSRSCGWDMFGEVANRGLFDSIAAALIPLEQRAGDPFWINAARTVFAETCAKLYKTDKGNITSLVQILLKSEMKVINTLLQGTVAASLIDERSEKTSMSIMAILATYLKSMQYLDSGAEQYNFRSWLQASGGGCVFLTSNGQIHQVVKPLISAWVEVAINNLLSMPQDSNRRVWFILDELPSLHMLPSLQQGLAELRQFGGCFVVSIQSIAQLRQSYEWQGAQIISALCNTKVFLRSGDIESGKWYSDNIGNSEIREYTEGLSYGAHAMRDGVNLQQHSKLRPLVLPVEFINLRPLEGYITMGSGYDVAKIQIKYKDYSKIAPQIIWKEENVSTFDHDILPDQAIDIYDFEE